MQVQAQHVASGVLPAQRLWQHSDSHIARFGHGGVLCGLAMVDFIAGHGHIAQLGPQAGQVAKLGLAMLHGFGDFKVGDQGQQPQAGRISVNVVHIDQRLAQHLQATADTQHRFALRRMCGNAGVQALRAQPGQVATRVLAAGQDHPIGIDNFDGAAYPFQAHTGHVFQRLEFVQIADAGVGYHGNRGGDSARGHASIVKHTVFFRQAMLPPHG